MAQYSEAIRARFMQPHYAYAGEPVDAQFEAGAVEQGALLQLFVTINHVTQHIERATFKMYGCGVCVAFADLFCERLTGMAYGELHTLNTHQLAQDLLLPNAKMHCVWLGNEVLAALLALEMGCN